MDREELLMDDVETNNLLAWHKVESSGYRPSARENHTSVEINGSVYIFGGFEAGQRVNSVIRFDISSSISSWNVITCTGDVPVSRCQHVAVAVAASIGTGSSSDEYMVIFGGECVVNTSQGPISQVTKANHSSPDVFPDDSLGQSLKSMKRISGAIESGDVEGGADRSVCLDDMYALHIPSSHWMKMHPQLSPLPRKGHSLTKINLKQKDKRLGYGEVLLLFGGFCKATDSCSNSIHICDVSEIIGNLKTANKDIQNANFSWRSLKCGGIAPSPRWSHSATMLTETNGRRNNLLAIYGGRTKGGDALNDLFILNIDTLTWSQPLISSDYERIATMRTIRGGDENSSGYHIPPAVYGHVAVACPKYSTSSEVLIIFGGCSSRSDKPQSGQRFRKLSCFDLALMSWSQVDSGYSYPAYRYFHSVSTIEGFSPPYTFPKTQSFESTGKQRNFDNNNSSCAIIFGGNNFTSVVSETWILDLTLRENGILQFDTSAAADITTEVQSTLTSTLALTSSSSNIHDGVASNAYGGTGASEDGMHVGVGVDIGTAFLKVKKERDMVHMLYAKEKQRAQNNDIVILDLQAQLQNMQLKQQEMQGKHENECFELRKALEFSVTRERNATSLHEEAMQLMMLQSFNASTSKYN